MPSTRRHQLLAAKRQVRVRSKINGTTARPRLTIFRSNQHTYLQVIDDLVGKTLVAGNTLQLKNVTGTKTQRAVALTKEIVDKLNAHKITSLVLDRGSHRYHGRIKAIAEALRAGKIEV